MSKKKKTPTVLVILDGWGMALPSKGNAVALARTPCFDSIWENYSRTLLQASGEAVGLPHGIMGNSELGHMNLGAGRIVPSDLVKIDRAIADGDFFQNPTLLSATRYVLAHKSNLHLMGLLSDGKVHSSMDHLFALLKLAKKEKVKNVYIHVFTDGRDTSPQSALKYVSDLEKQIKKLKTGKIVSISGRYYAMDRAHKWNRTKKVFDMMIHGKDKKAHSAKEAIEESYKKGKSDEFIEPTFILYNHQRITIQNNDAIIFFNLRSDRARQLTKPFVLDNFNFFKRGKVPENIFFVGLTSFGDDLPMMTAFPESRIEMNLAEALSQKPRLKQLYITEEEKFGPLAFFFHGGFSIPFVREKKVMIKSKKVATYDLYPKMSAKEITDYILKNFSKYDFIGVNYANPDMLGHTGNIPAAVKGLEFTDKCLAKVIDKTLKKEGNIIVTADHGNVEEMIDLETGKVDTKHSTNPVPFILVGKRFKRQRKKKLREGILGEVAPTILEIMDIPQPEKMTGKSLL